MGSLGDGGLQSLPLALSDARQRYAVSGDFLLWPARSEHPGPQWGAPHPGSPGRTAHSRAGNCGSALCTRAHPAVREVAMMPQPRRPRHSVHRGRGLAHRLLVGMIGDFAGQIAFGNSFPIALARH